MEREIKEMNIFEKMSKITEKINRIAKNLQVGVGKSQYKAVGEADVLAEVKPAEVEFGVYSYPISREIVYSNEFTTTSEYNGETKEKLTMFMRLKTVYRFVNIDKPSEFIDIETYGDGVDTQDKAPGKAMTYADKYALLKAYKIETGEDPDQDPSRNMNKKGKQEPKKDPEVEYITEEQKAELFALGVKLDDVAIYRKQPTIDTVTKADAQKIIDIKKKEKEKEKTNA